MLALLLSIASHRWSTENSFLPAVDGVILTENVTNPPLGREADPLRTWTHTSTLSPDSTTVYVLLLNPTITTE